VNAVQVRDYVIRPALQRVGLWSPAAEQLVFGTGLVETGYNWLDQTTPGPGPAYGPWQMEEPTHTDIWDNYLAYQTDLNDALVRMAGFGVVTKPPVIALHGNLFYGAAMCRVHYRRMKAPLPAAGDAPGMAAYWKNWYNTPAGAGTLAKAIPFFRQAVAP
jgi:hypothetical protein